MTIKNQLSCWMHYLEALAAQIVFYHPGKMKILGITGTDGKTTTSYWLYYMLSSSGAKVALMNGLTLRIGEKEWPNPTDNTTPRAWEVARFVKQAKQEGCEYCVIEVTSWGLVQHRVLGVSFMGAGLTNLTMEHQDLHPTTEDYKKAKGILFKKASSAPFSVLSVNREDPASDYFLSFKASSKVSYSTKNNPRATLNAVNIQLNEDSSEFDILENQQKIHARIFLPGSYNIENFLCAAGLARGLGISWEAILQGGANFKGAPGRFEKIQAGQNFPIIVDFGHTPGAFENVFSNIRKIYPGHRLIAVFGSAGGRDPIKRPFLGEVAGKLTDFVVLTTDDPRFEDPRKIAKEIEAGLVKSGKRSGEGYVFIEDRKAAIAKAISMADSKTVVITLGMGPYEAMYVRGGTVPWNDKKAILEILNFHA